MTISEWKLEKYNSPAGEWIILHDITHVESGEVFDRPHYVWPHKYSDSSIQSTILEDLETCWIKDEEDIPYSFGYCMTCKLKAPDNLILQLELLNGT